jgi:ribosomal protein S19
MSDSENCEEEIEVPFDNIIDFDNYEIFETKMANLARVQPKVFNIENYNIEEAVKIKDQKGEEFEKKIPLLNYIRWRYSEENEIEDDEENSENTLLKRFNLEKKSKKNLESNAKIVEWSDGTWQLIIGDEHIDITLSDINNTRVGIVNKEKDIVVVSKNIDKKLILKASDYNESNAKKEIATYKNDSKIAGSKVKLVYSYYDNNSYVKEDFGGKFGKTKIEKKGENDVIIQTHFKKKRNRSESYGDN